MQFSARIAGQAIRPESFFRGHVFVAYGLAESRTVQEDYRVVQVVTTRVDEDQGELSVSGPQSVARDSSTILGQWYTALAGQLGVWMDDASYQAWRAEATQYGVLSGDDRAEELLERGEVLYLTTSGFVRCQEGWGPKGKDPNVEKCENCCETEYDSCLATAATAAIGSGSVSCVVAGAACVSNPVSLAAVSGCCAAAAAVATKAVYWVADVLICRPRHSRCIEHCAS
jgi:hypothetical protein